MSNSATLASNTDVNFCLSACVYSRFITLACNIDLAHIPFRASACAYFRFVSHSCNVDLVQFHFLPLGCVYFLFINVACNVYLLCPRFCVSVCVYLRFVSLTRHTDSVCIYFSLLPCASFMLYFRLLLLSRCRFLFRYCMPDLSITFSASFTLQLVRTFVLTDLFVTLICLYFCSQPSSCQWMLMIRL